MTETMQTTNIHTGKTSPIDPGFAYFLQHDLSEYEGEWIAIKNQQVVVDDPKEHNVRQHIREHYNGDALITHIPRPDRALLL